MLNRLQSALKSKELAIRIASALVLIPIVLWLTMWGDLDRVGAPFNWLESLPWAKGARPLPFLVLLSLVVALLCSEWVHMILGVGRKYMTVFIALAAIAPMWVVFAGHALMACLVLALGAGIVGLISLGLKQKPHHSAYGVLYVGIPALTLMWVRETQNGLYWALFAILIAWASDSAAYFSGRWFKGPKLWPRFSPNKTWAGFVGGLIAGILAAEALGDMTKLFAHATSAFFVGLLTALATMAGDLWESAIKRHFGVKDAGSLIPGHGGLLDRVDGLMFAIVMIGVIRLAVFLGTVI